MPSRWTTINALKKDDRKASRAEPQTKLIRTCVRFSSLMWERGRFGAIQGFVDQLHSHGQRTALPFVVTPEIAVSVFDANLQMFVEGITVRAVRFPTREVFVVCKVGDHYICSPLALVFLALP